MNKVVSKNVAREWDEALPLGNGILGALVYGGVSFEYVIFNHENHYLPFDNNFDLGESDGFIDTIKDEVLKGNYSKIEKMIDKKYSTMPGKSDYQPLCELTIETDVKGEKRNYFRQLDMENAEVLVSFESEGTVYTRRQFVSKKYNEFVMEITNSDKKKMTSKIALNARLVSQPFVAKEILAKNAEKFDVKHKVDGDTIYFDATYKKGGSFGGELKVVTDGKLGLKVDYEGYENIVCSDYTYLTIYVTGYAYCEKTKPVILPYNELFEENAEYHKEIYNRVQASFGYSSDKCTEEFIFEANTDNPDPAMYELMFNMSRYMFITSSIGCKYPPNLQGIWNGRYKPYWGCDFHNDENIQLCMWQALSLGTPEAVETYMDYYNSFMDDYRQNAKYYFNADGIALPIAQTLSGKALGGKWNFMPGMGGWIAQLYYNYYLYTENKEILKEKVYPFVKGCADFYLSFCTIIDGKCQFIPSISPENKPIINKENLTDDNKPALISANATFDVAIAKEVLTNIISISKVLGYKYDKYEEFLKMIPDYKINKDGAIKEWLNDELEDNYEHRHISHLYPLFPGDEVNAFNNPEMFNAIKIAAEKRMVVGITSQSGWSLTHLSHVYSRLNDGENALNCLRMLLRTSILSNLFTLHNDSLPRGNSLYWWDLHAFQADANMGFASAISEMFLYSTGDGYVKIAPALPDLFKNAKIKGLWAKGNLKVDIELENGFAHTTIYANKEKTIKLDLNGEVKDITLKIGANKLS